MMAMHGLFVHCLKQSMHDDLHVHFLEIQSMISYI